MCVWVGVGCVQRRAVPRGTAQTRLSQPACRLLARCRSSAAAAGVARVRALLQGHAPVVGLPRRLGKWTDSELDRRACDARRVLSR